MRLLHVHVSSIEVAAVYKRSLPKEKRSTWYFIELGQQIALAGAFNACEQGEILWPDCLTRWLAERSLHDTQRVLEHLKTGDLLFEPAVSEQQKLDWSR